MKETNKKKGVTLIFSTRGHMVMDHARRLIHVRDGLVSDD